MNLHDGGWNEHKRFNFFFPNIKNENGSKDIFKLIKKTRILCLHTLVQVI